MFCHKIFSWMWSKKWNRKRNRESCQVSCNRVSLKRGFRGVTPTRNTSGNKWVCPQRDYVCAALGPQPRLMKSIPNGKSFRMAVVDLRRAPHGPCWEIYLEWTLFVGNWFVLDSRAVRLSDSTWWNQFRMENHFEWPCGVDLHCAPHGPRLENNLDRKLIPRPCFVLNFRAVLRAA